MSQLSTVINWTSLTTDRWNNWHFQSNVPPIWNPTISDWDMDRTQNQDLDTKIVNFTFFYTDLCMSASAFVLGSLLTLRCILVIHAEKIERRLKMPQRSLFLFLCWYFVQTYGPTNQFRAQSLHLLLVDNSYSPILSIIWHNVPLVFTSVTCYCIYWYFSSNCSILGANDNFDTFISCLRRGFSWKYRSKLFNTWSEIKMLREVTHSESRYTLTDWFIIFHPALTTVFTNKLNTVCSWKHKFDLSHLSFKYTQ